MSVVTLAVGQCGNQLGDCLLDTLHSELDDDELSTFFRQSATGSTATARAVLVDMEPKVIWECTNRRKRGRWRYQLDGSFYKHGGSGNNWAMGYSTHGSAVEDKICNLVRREAEACDFLGGFVLVQSVAGGTGSGLGARLTDALRDRFEGATVLNAAVWPHTAGDVIVQSYNTVLTMAHLSLSSHAILCLRNDYANEVCVSKLRRPRPALADLNEVLARDVAAAALLPSVATSRPLHGFSVRGIQDVLGNISNNLCAHPGYPLLEAKTLPQMARELVAFSSDTWTSLIKRLHQMHLTCSEVDERIDWSPSATASSASRSVAQTLTLRGAGAGSFARDAGLHLSAPGITKATDRGPREASHVIQCMADRNQYTAWAKKSPLHVRVRDGPSAFGGYERIASLLSNGRSCVEPLERSVVRAFDMWSSRAYVHQYAPHGIDHDHFIEAFAQVEQLLANYHCL